MEQSLSLINTFSLEKSLFLKWLGDLSVSGNITKALIASGLKRTTVYRWRKEDQEFAKEWDSTIKYGDEVMADIAEYKLREAAIKKGNVRAIIFVLKCLRPEVWNTTPYCKNCGRRSY